MFIVNYHEYLRRYTLFSIYPLSCGNPKSRENIEKIHAQKDTYDNS